MVRQAENISKGNFSIITDTRKDELTRLSDSLNIMSGTLNANINELEQRNAELDKFAYVVSHDLKAPLRGIHNVVKWIQEDHQNELSPQMKQYLDIIPERTKRMEDLINGLLDYARIRKRNVTEKTDVYQLVKEIVEEIVPEGFDVDISNLPEIFTEKLKLKQVFTNLISNAVKYTQHPNGHISIGCKQIPGYYEFSVKDNGMGISAEYHAKIFELFQTLRDKDEAESTGIGLAIVKKIIDEEHGMISVNSETGKGSEFIFRWPVKNEIKK
jgi:signal transduction histidine kinase